MLPAMLDYAGIQSPASLEGLSLRPLIERKAVKWRDHTIAEMGEENLGRMVRTSRYKYTTYGLHEIRDQFFDLETDPGETKNLIRNSAFAEEVVRYRGLLQQWMQSAKNIFDNASAHVKGNQAKDKNNK